MANEKKPINLMMKNHELKTILQKTNEINRIKKAIIPYLEANLLPFISFSYDFKETVIFIVERDAIAFRLRLIEHELLEQFKKNNALSKIKKIQIKIKSHQHQKRESPPKPRETPRLSEKNAEIVKKIAEEMTDTKLKKVMENIAKRTKE